MIPQLAAFEGLKKIATSPILWMVIGLVGLLWYISHRENIAATGAAALCQADVYQTALKDTQKQLKDATDAAEAARTQADNTQALLDSVSADRDEALRLIAAGPATAYPPKLRDKLEGIRSRFKKSAPARP